ncbi:MAG: fumarylacetoacetase [Pirellulaceae bacterium]
MHASINDPELRSFAPASAESHFPIQNLPYGVFRPKGGGEPRVGVAIGEQVLDLALLEAKRLLDVPALTGREVFNRSSLNAFMALGKDAWSQVRARISELLRDDTPMLRDNAALREKAFLKQSDVAMLPPIEIGDYTDFYSSRYHAANVGSLFRDPESALPPNWLHLPIAYHGRASSVVLSGTDIRRPLGQTMPEGAKTPVFGPSRAFDFELEMGYIVGTGNELGSAISVEQAADHVFGMVLVNDWSARDIQRWEYAPLGPFLSKNLGTSISPWVVTMEALAPFAASGCEQEPTPLPYLRSPGNPTYDVNLEVWLQPAEGEPRRISASNLRHMYWNIRQQIAHHTVGGCNLQTGDLLATGTISGPTPDSLGCLLEITRGGREPLQLGDGVARRFLDDGDRITLTGWAQGDGYRVGFGECTGRVLPAREQL